MAQKFKFFVFFRQQLRDYYVLSLGHHVPYSQTCNRVYRCIDARHSIILHIGIQNLQREEIDFLETYFI